MNKAKALATYCIEKSGNAEAMRQDLEVIDFGIREGLVKILDNPSLGIDKKVLIAKKVFRENISLASQHFLKYLITEDCWELVGKIRFEYDKLLAEKSKIARVTVVSAEELGEGQKEYLKKGLEEKLGKNILLENEVDEEILGGLQIKIEDKNWDNSLKGKIDNLYKTISQED